MRSRAVATIAIWFANIVALAILVNSLTYTYTDYTRELTGTYGHPDLAAQTYTFYPTMTAFAPDPWIFAVAGLCLVIIIGSAVATAAIWKRADESERSVRDQARMIYGDMPSRAESVKAKNDQRARAQRLMDSLSPEELAELEYYYANERGQEEADPIQLEMLMRHGKSS
jgi:hypothetical protein